jgi:hypothetical protein
LSASALGTASAATLIVLYFIGAYRDRPDVRMPPVSKILIVSAVVVAVRLLIQAWFFAPYNGDVASYHLPKIAEWVRAGGFTREMGLDTHVTFPAGFELVETWWVVFLHHDLLIELAGLEFLAISFVATYVIARSCELGPSGAFLSALIYTLTPGIHLQATACMTDAPVAALVLSAVAMVSVRASPAVLVLILGLGVGVKPTFSYILPGLLVIAVPLLRGWRSWLTFSGRNLVLGGLGGVLGSFWYIRNLVWFGNPIYPMGSKGVLEVTGHATIQAGPSVKSLAQNLAHLLDSRMFDTGGPWGSLMTDISGWGPAVICCGFVALLTLLPGNKFLIRLSLGFLISAVFVFLLVLPDSWSMRFILFIPSLFAVAAAKYCDRHGFAYFILVPALLFEFAGTMLPAELPMDRFETLASQRWSARSVAPFFDADAPGNTIGYFADHYGEVYFLYRPDFSRRVVYLRADTIKDLLLDLDREHVALVYALPTSRRTASILQEGVRLRRLQPLTERVFAVR